MSKDPKFTWGDSVVVDGDQAGSVCGITESENGVAYTVEFSDGSDELIAEDRLHSVQIPDV